MKCIEVKKAVFAHNFAHAYVEKLGSFEWKNNGEHLNRMLSIYMPIIQKFIEDATADLLNVPLNEENNPKMWMKLTVF